MFMVRSPSAPCQEPGVEPEISQYLVQRLAAHCKGDVRCVSLARHTVFNATANAELASPHTPLTKEQLKLLVDSLPLDELARINYNEFMAAFEAVDTIHYERTSA